MAASGGSFCVKWQFTVQFLTRLEAKIMASSTYKIEAQPKNPVTAPVRLSIRSTFYVTE